MFTIPVVDKESALDLIDCWAFQCRELHQVLFEEAGTADGVYGEANIWKLQPKIFDAVLHLELQENISHISFFAASPRNLRVAEERWRRIDADVVPLLEADVREAGAEIYWILQDFQLDQGGIIKDHCRYWYRDVLHFSLSFFCLFFLVFSFPISLSVLKRLLFVPCLCLFLHFFSGFLPLFWFFPQASKKSTFMKAEVKQGRSLIWVLKDVVLYYLATCCSKMLSNGKAKIRSDQLFWLMKDDVGNAREPRTGSMVWRSWLSQCCCCNRWLGNLVSVMTRTEQL